MEDFVVYLTPDEEEIRQIVEPLIDAEGFELVKIRVRRARDKLLIYLFVDKKNPPPGIVMDDLAHLSLFLGDVLSTKEEEHQILRGQYQLEVSSPGLDRPLCKKSHFEQARGQNIKARLKDKSLVGILVNVLDNSFVIGEEKTLFEDVNEANIIFSFGEKGLKKAKNKKKLGSLE